MTVIRVEMRSGTYADSVVLMQVQKSLRDQPGIQDAAVLLGTPANHQLLRSSGLWTSQLEGSGPDDLLIVVRGEADQAVRKALAKFDSLMDRHGTDGGDDFRPRSLETALRLLPEARFALVSLPGRHAAGVAREALDLNLNVFLYSDNVSLEDEISLKRRAAEKGLLLMGPDCGTSRINGVGLGFANRVSRGSVGLIGASGTGLQLVSCLLHAAGLGVSQMIGTGGRDLEARVEAITTRQAIQLLGDDPDTRLVVLVSKPASADLADRLLREAARLPKPVVAALQGYLRPARRLENISFASTLEEAANLAIELEREMTDPSTHGHTTPRDEAPNPFGGRRSLHGLFSGGTLAREAVQIMGVYVDGIQSNLEAPLTPRPDARLSGHWVLDLGADEFTAGRLHPMLDQELRCRKIVEAAENPEVAVILLDVVLGDGAHPDPAAELAPAIEKARRIAWESDRNLDVLAVVVGSDQDPQGLERQTSMLAAAGADVESSLQAAASRAGRRLAALSPPDPVLPPVNLSDFQGAMAAINVGLESFAESLRLQGARVVHVDWRPPAGGDRRMAEILARMKGQ